MQKKNKKKRTKRLGPKQPFIISAKLDFSAS